MEWFRLTSWMEPVAGIVLLILAGSLIQGMLRGASGSARRLFYFIGDAVLALVSLAVAGRTAAWLSPIVRRWLEERRIALPETPVAGYEQLWYTFITSMRDFGLLRFGVLFLGVYVALRLAFALLSPLTALALEALGMTGQPLERTPGRRAASRAAGAALGALLGAARGMVLLAILFVYVSLVPGGPLTGPIEASPLYREAADQVMKPVAGDVIEKQGPVIAKAVADEFGKVLQRKYEIIDSDIPDDIGEAARAITAGKASDRDKAYALYQWVGTRIAYDWDKANNYVERGVWKEQTPADTFRTRKGVCIDTSRLYAVMARAAGLEVNVVTGMGADGRGGFGPHAWNEVKLDGEWVPLDATWASSGNWFDAPDFGKTHIRET